jgi:hypothetical protein
MYHISFSRFQGKFVWGGVLVLMLLLSACSGVASNGGQSSTGATTPTTSATTSASSTQGSATPTQAPATTPATTSASFKPGGISFIGPVKSITTSSLVMTAPNGQSYTLALTPQTDLSAFNGSRPTVGASVDMDAVVNPDGSFSVTQLQPATPGDPDTNVISYTGMTTSAVGTDRVIHFTVGTRSYTFTIPASADLSDFGGNAQAIGINVSVKVKVQVPSNTVVSVGNASSSSSGQ